MNEATRGFQKDISFPLAHYRGTLGAAFRECVEIERTLGLKNGEHIGLYHRLEQWRDLLERLEAENKTHESEMNMRDLQKDWELCNAATPGPWKADDNEFWHVGESYESANDPHIYLGRVTDHCDQCMANLRFIVAAREGWPHAIRRAMAAENYVLSMVKQVLEDEGRGYIVSGEILDMALTLSRIYKEPKEMNQNA